MDYRIFAIGDIHGCYNTFEELLSQINPSRNDKIILLGDYIDRGAHIKKVIDRIIKLKEDGYDVVPLKGNHEGMLWDSAKNNKAYTLWMYNGGEETLRSFGIRSVHEMDRKYIIFFKSLLYYFSWKQFLFVHAGFSDNSNEVFEDKNAMLWSRREEYCSDFFNGKTIIHGHTPISRDILLETVNKGNNVINLDTGCIYSIGSAVRHLSAIEIPSLKITSVKNIDNAY